MSAHRNDDGSLEHALRRDARVVREAPSPERAARILSALDGVERAESFRDRRRPVLAAAAALLLLAAAWLAWGPASGPSGSADSHGRSRVARTSSAVPSGSMGEATGRPRGVSGGGIGLGAWADQSLAALRSGVDDPLQREVRALSRDAGRMLTRVRLDVTGVLGRLLDAPR